MSARSASRKVLLVSMAIMAAFVTSLVCGITPALARRDDIQEVTQELPQEITQELTQEDPQELTQEDPQVLPQEDPQVLPQEDPQEPSQELTPQASPVEYIERSWDGSQVVSQTKSADCTSLNNGIMQLNGWYVVDSFVWYMARPTVTGTANIILSDANGCTLYLADGINVPEGTTLNIYCQQGGAGRFYALADTNDQAAIGGNSGQSAGTIAIHGGNIMASSYNDNKGDDAAGIGGGLGGNGGNVNAYGANSSDSASCASPGGVR